MTIHIVEDDPGVGDALSLLLQQLGHETIVYADAEAFFRHTPPVDGDTVIVDLCLPGMPGMQVIRWLKSLNLQLKIIAISGQPQASIRRMLQGETPDILLRKPLREEALTKYL
ncbi:response regulator [Stappia albiluteola]|uniref:response regulator n=1 Tax=Stappia albiluteola TaxID=2758565 RepID=UPI001AD8E7F5|nr:response regulator [Stappia albiluteola]